MPVYACVDNRELLEVPETDEIPGQTDLSIAGHSYRKLDMVFLAWITARIQTAIKAPRIDQDALGSAIAFRDQCNAAMGFPEALPSVPSGYQKPTIAEDTSWLMELEW